MSWPSRSMMARLGPPAAEAMLQSLRSRLRSDSSPGARLPMAPPPRRLPASDSCVRLLQAARARPRLPAPAAVMPFADRSRRCRVHVAASPGQRADTPASPKLASPTASACSPLLRLSMADTTAAVSGAIAWPLADSSRSVVLPSNAAQSLATSCTIRLNGV